MADPRQDVDHHSHLKLCRRSVYEHEPVKTNQKGMHDSGCGKVAWFKDPDGNTHAVEQS